MLVTVRAMNMSVRKLFLCCLPDIQNLAFKIQIQPGQRMIKIDEYTFFIHFQDPAGQRVTVLIFHGDDLTHFDHSLIKMSVNLKNFLVQLNDIIFGW